MSAARSIMRVRTSGQVQLRRTDRRLQRPWRERLDEPLLIEIEKVQLELALLCELFALRLQPGIGRSVGVRGGIASQQEVAGNLLLLELLLLHALLELQLVETARIGGREVGVRRAQRLLKVQIERV